MHLPHPVPRLRSLGAALTLALALPGSALLSSCEEKAHAQEEHATFPVTTPLREDTEIVREYVCQIRAIQRVELKAMERGYLQEVLVDEGQHVEKGQPMFRTMRLIYDAELKRAEAEVEFARIEYENTKALEVEEIVSPQETALAEAKYKKAQAEAALAAAHVTLTEVRAPFSGIMDRLHVRPGSLLEEGELLTSLSDTSKMWVYFNVTEAEYLEYQARSRGSDPPVVQLLMANGEIFEHDGVADTIEGEFHNSTGTIAFRATFPNPDGLLRHGQTGEILLSTKLKHALLIPQKATFEVLDRKFVFVLDEENRVRSREITIAAEKPHLFAVASGLEEGDRILVEGLRRVHEGEEILFDLHTPEEILATLAVPAE